MNKEELLKEIMKLPKIETKNPISAMNSINVDDLMSAIDRLNKIPDYNDLLKENQELKKQVEISKMANDKNVDIACELIIKYKNQQQEFIKYLEDKIKHFKDLEQYAIKIFNNKAVINLDLVKRSIEEDNLLICNFEEILQKCKSIIGDINDKK